MVHMAWSTTRPPFIPLPQHPCLLPTVLPGPCHFTTRAGFLDGVKPGSLHTLPAACVPPRPLPLHHHLPAHPGHAQVCSGPHPGQRAHTQRARAVCNPAWVRYVGDWTGAVVGLLRVLMGRLTGWNAGSWGLEGGWTGCFQCTIGPAHVPAFISVGMHNLCPLPPSCLLRTSGLLLSHNRL
jgi:hypothetical protein